MSDMRQAPIKRSNASGRFDRRSLLVAGAVSGAAAMLPRSARAKAGTPAPSAGIGYILDSESSTGLGTAPPWLGSSPLTVVPASSILPDRGLASNSPVIVMHGLFPGAPGPGSMSRLDVDAVFGSPARRGEGPFPFSAWSFAAGNPSSSSSRIAFTMPVDAAGNLNFALQLTAEGATTTIPAALSLDSRSTGARLRAGFYLLAINGTPFSRQFALDPAAEPDWSLLSLVLSVRPGG